MRHLLHLSSNNKILHLIREIRIYVLRWKGPVSGCERPVYENKAQVCALRTVSVPCVTWHVPHWTLPTSLFLRLNPSLYATKTSVYACVYIYIDEAWKKVTLLSLSFPSVFYHSTPPSVVTELSAFPFSSLFFSIYAISRCEYPHYYHDRYLNNCLPRSLKG